MLARQVVRLEREYWSLAEGPWAGGEGMAFRQQWLAGLRSASSVGEVAHALLQLEEALRPLAFADEWRGGEAGGAAGAAGAAGAVPEKGAGEKGAAASRPPSRTVSRAPSGADLASLAGGQTSQQGELSASLAALDGTPASAAAAAAARAADPYDIRYEKMVLGGWEMNKRMVVARMHGVNRLPLALARKVRRVARCRLWNGIACWSLAGPVDAAVPLLGSTLKLQCMLV